MKPAPLLAAFLAWAACGGAQPTARQVAGPDVPEPTQAAADNFAGEQGPPPPYTQGELAAAVSAEHDALAKADHAIADLADGDPDALRVALADRAVRGRFAAVLERCQATQRDCPPRLDDPTWAATAWDRDAPVATTAPPLTAALRFDLADWRVIAHELAGRACACRTVACLDDLDAAADALETRPTREVAADEVAGADLAVARACTMQLRGRAHRRTHVELAPAR